MIEIALLLVLGARAAPAPGGAPAKAAALAEPLKERKKPMEWKGQYGGPGEPGHRVITDAKAWAALWKTLGKDAPALDFKTHAAVAVFIGERPTGGWSAVFEEPRPEDGDTVLVYSIRAPRGFTTQAFTQPYVVRAVPRPAKGRLVVREEKAE